jgi:hypothetical protein
MYKNVILIVVVASLAIGIVAVALMEDFNEVRQEAYNEGFADGVNSVDTIDDIPYSLEYFGFDNCGQYELRRYYDESLSKIYLDADEWQQRTYRFYEVPIHNQRAEYKVPYECFDGSIVYPAD